MWNNSDTWVSFAAPAPAPDNWNMIKSTGAAAGDANVKVYSYPTWWLRSPGDTTGHAGSVFSDGYVGYGLNGNITSYLLALRPALWVRADILH